MKKIMIVFLCIIFMCNNIDALSISNKSLFKRVRPKKKTSIKYYPRTKGSILVTPDLFKNILPLGHAAIVYNAQFVYEATNKGVVRGLNNWNITKKRVFGLRVKNLSNNAHSKAANYAKRQAKKKYNFNYYNTRIRKKFYCSHLIFASFYDLFKVNLDTKLFGLAGKRNGAIHPLELVLSKKTKKVYYNER
ncbi:MAG: YiiX/YebB-like N1pC/P60 family cysteine hydrolase [Erysipelotrichales bacterium]